jgi:Na+-transporting methylmalonyl-CoA/oxaloacetate decarboxylase gamma subunit
MEGGSMKQVLIGLGVLTLIATLATVGLVLFGQGVAAAIVGTMTVFFWLALLIVATVAISSWWSGQLMRQGAELALRSQESDDRRDVALLKTLSSLSRTQRQQPALPMPQQQGDWLPELSEFVSEGEFTEVER